MLTRLHHRAAVVAAFVAASALVSPAKANITFKPVGHPFGTNGWSQQFSLVSTAPFENLGLALLPSEGDDGTSGFAAPASELYGGSGGALGSVQSFASGGSVEQLLWQSHFTGAPAGQEFILTLFTYDEAMSGSSVQTVSVKWDGSWWSANTSPGITWEQYQDTVSNAGPSIVPTPSAVLLGIFGLMLVGGARRLGR